MNNKKNYSAYYIPNTTKHLIFVETGRSNPSRNLVLKIADQFKLPFRHRNALLIDAGFAPVYGELPFDGKEMEIVREALHRLLESHNPYPAFVVNAGYKILLANSGYDQFVTFYAGESALKKYDNVIRILFSEDGLRPYVKDWSTIKQILIEQLWEEAISTQNAELMALYKELSQGAISQDPDDYQMDLNLPVMSFVFEKSSKKASFFATIATLRTPLDLTTQELRIELLFPSDEETKKMFPLKM